MNISNVRRIAKEKGVKVGRIKKADMIRAIQVAEGNNPCFGTGIENCAYKDCLWREDCV